MNNRRKFLKLLLALPVVGTVPLEALSKFSKPGKPNYRLLSQEFALMLEEVRPYIPSMCTLLWDGLMPDLVSLRGQTVFGLYNQTDTLPMSYVFYVRAAMKGENGTWNTRSSIPSDFDITYPNVRSVVEKTVRMLENAYPHKRYTNDA